MRVGEVDGPDARACGFSLGVACSGCEGFGGLACGDVPVAMSKALCSGICSIGATASLCPKISIHTACWRSGSLLACCCL